MDAVRWADAVSAQNENDAILDPSWAPSPLRNRSADAPTWPTAVCSYTQEITLHYVVVDREKEMEYGQRVRSFRNFLHTFFRFPETAVMIILAGF